MSLKDEYRDLLSSTRLTLAETFEAHTRLPKDFKELHDFHKKNFPDYPVYETSPLVEIALLSFSELATHQTFLAMLGQAIQLRFGKVAQVVGTSGWERSKLVISPDYGIWGDPALAKNFREGEKAGQNFLGNIPLFLLTDLSLYMREPKLKSSLWKALCQEIGSLK